MSDLVTIVRAKSPLVRGPLEYAKPGATVADLIGGANPLSPHLKVGIAFGDAWHPVPGPLRRVVRPKAGATVTIMPVTHGRNELALAAAVALAVAAPYAGAAAFGAGFGAGGSVVAGTTAGFFGTSALGASLVTAGVTVVGSLAINKLIAPPQPRQSGRGGAAAGTVFDISGSSNEVTPYEPYPIVIGRHRMAPRITGLPFTPTFETDTVLHQRFTFGYGPVALETLQIGGTPIHLFNRVEVELLNVDQTETLARYPELASVVVGWRQGSEPMTLYTADIAEDRYGVALTPDAPVIRRTRLNTRRVEVEISFPEGLGFITADGSLGLVGRTLRVRYRKVGESVWNIAQNPGATRAQRTPFRINANFDVPAPGEYEIEVTRTSIDEANTGQVGAVFDDTFLTAIRSVADASLPSHPEIAEVAIRIVANEQLNGPIGNLTGIVHRMVPVWNGVAWTPPQITRHPAWHFADMLRGPMRDNPAADSEIDLDGLRDWAIATPDRTCDYVLSGSESVAEALDIIASAGRAQRGMPGGKYGVIREQADGPLVQLFAPSNIIRDTFKTEIRVPSEIHGFRVLVVSEDADWQRDEVVVYADGYDASTATIFETLELPGVVLTAGQRDGGNAWRDGRYHLAQHVLRPETFEWGADLDHLVCHRGDRVRLVHDVASLGVGAGRITAVTTSGANLATITINNAFDVASGSYFLTIRRADGTMVELNATGGDMSHVWTVTGTVPAADIAMGDMVTIEEIELGSFDVIVTEVLSLDRQQATFRGIPAAPGVLTAEAGVIPPYQPRVSTADRSDRPQVPSILRAFSGPQAVQRIAGGADQPRIGIEVASQARQQVQPVFYRTRWRRLGATEWTESAPQPVASVVFTDTLARQQSYQVAVQSMSDTGRSLGWSDPVLVFAFIEDSVGTVQNLRSDVLGFSARLTWDRPSPNVDFYIIRHSTDPAATWGECVELEHRPRGTSADVPAFNGVYHVRAVSIEGVIGKTSATVVVNSGSLIGVSPTEIEAHPGWTGTTSGGAAVDGSTLTFAGSVNDIGDWTDIGDVDDIATYLAQPAEGMFVLTALSNLGSVQTRRVAAEVRSSGAYDSYLIDQWTDIGDVIDIGGGADTTWRLRPMIRTTNDTGGSPTWGDWRPFLAGDYTYAQAQFALAGDQDEDAVTITVTEWTITIGTAA